MNVYNLKEEEKEMSDEEVAKYSRKPKCFSCMRLLNIKVDQDGICMTPDCARNETLKKIRLILVA